MELTIECSQHLTQEPSPFDAGYKHKQVRTCCFSWSSPRNRLVSSRSHLSNHMTCPDKAWPKTRGNLTSLTKLTRRIAFPTSFPGHDRPKRSKNSHFQNEAKCKTAVVLHFMSETSKSTGVRKGRRKVEDSSEKKKDLSSNKERQNNDSSQSFLDKLGLNVSQSKATLFYTRRWSRLLSASERRA